MPISPEEITSKEFFVSGDGYDREEVKEFLELVANDQRILLERIESLTASPERLGDAGAEVAVVLKRAAELADRLTNEAEVNARTTRSRVEEEAATLRTTTAEAVDRMRQEAEQYSFEVRTRAERAAREQQLHAADRVGRLLAGESTVREKLYALETTLQAMRGDLRDAAETVLPEMKNIGRPLPPAPPGETPRVIDLREDPVAIGANGSHEQNAGPNGSRSG